MVVKVGKEKHRVKIQKNDDDCSLRPPISDLFFLPMSPRYRNSRAGRHQPAARREPWSKDNGQQPPRHPPSKAITGNAITGDVIGTVVRAGQLLEAAGDYRGAAEIYGHFITEMRTRALTPIESQPTGAGSSRDGKRATIAVDMWPVHSNPSRYTLA
jgi:hypothetical protein